MSELDETAARLEGLGRAEPPPPPADFVAGLTAGRLVRRHPARSRPVRRLSVVLPAAAVAAAVLGFVLVTFGGDDSRALVVREAVHAFVETDGVRREIQPGDELADGDRVTTGPSGSLTAGDVVLGPRARAVVDGEELRPEPITTTTTVASRPSVTTTTPSRPPDPGRATSTSPPPAGTPTTTTTRPADGAPATVRLTAIRRRDGSAALGWSRYPGDDFGAYVVVREDGSVAFRTEDVEELQAADASAPAGPTHYELVVVDPAGRPVARSEAVAVGAA